MSRKFLLLILVGLFTIIGMSCGGSATTPGDDEYRVLGVAVKGPLPSIIAFTRDIYDPDSYYDINREIFLMGPGGNHEHRLTYDPAADDYPAFAPFGMGLAFTSNRTSGGYGSYDIFRIGMFGLTQQLTDDTWQWTAHGTDWGPGFITAARINTLTGAPFDVGQMVKINLPDLSQDYVATGFGATYTPAIGRSPHEYVFSARPPNGWYWGSKEIYMLVDTQVEPVRLTFYDEETDGPMDMVFSTDPQFDRKAHKVIFQTTHWGSTEIAYIDLMDDTPEYEIIRLTNNEYADMEPCFDPTGNWFCWASDRDGNFELYKQRLYDPNSPTPIPPVIRLTETEEDEHHPDWAALFWKHKRLVGEGEL